MKHLPITAALLAMLAGILGIFTRPSLALRDTPNGEIGSRQTLGQFSNARINSTSNSAHQVRSRGIPVTPEFVRNLATGPKKVSFSLPNGKTAGGEIEQWHRTADGSSAGVTGRLDTPSAGTFFFMIQPEGSSKDPVVGAVWLRDRDTAFRVIPGSGETSLLAEMDADQVICRNTTPPPQQIVGPQEIPAEHPSYSIPGYQNGIIPLQSRPGALGVLYLDYDGQAGPHPSWSPIFNAAAPNVTNTQIKEVWARVSEDFAPFNLNVTTDLQVFLAAPPTSRQRCIVTPTDTASPGSGGVAWPGSFEWGSDTPCWAFIAAGKNAAEIISHELGHTLGLYHDGRASPTEEYYLGHGTDPVGWAPIMGLGYYKNLTQWSKGEYPFANQLQDDLAVIAGNTNVGFRPDDAGDTHATAATLEIFNSGTVDSEGTIETRTDVDAYRFTVGTGGVSFQISPVSPGPNLDIRSTIHNSAGNIVLTSNPDTSNAASFFTTLAAGEYTLRVDGTGRGDPNTTGYTDYGSLGQYTISGTISGAIGPDRFTVAENIPADTFVGVPTLRKDHAGAPLTYSISSGNINSAFTIDPTSGAITVLTPSVLNYELLSTSWTSPPVFDLSVTVVDSVNPSLNESLRVVISITNTNEPPTLTSPGALTAFSRSVIGTVLGRVSATDPDTYDLPSFSIVSGNQDGKFAISPSGEISVSGELIVNSPNTYNLSIRATDQGVPPLSNDVSVSITVLPAPHHLTPGVVTQNIFENISGSLVSDLTSHSTFPGQPTRNFALADFTTATTQGTDYGSAVRSWMIAPTTGTYRFWISGNSAADLFFSAAGNPQSITRIAYLEYPTNFQQWTAFTEQQSTTFNLTAGQVCYVEARHKISSGYDHLSVAWEIKDLTNPTILTPRSVIPGRYLAPYLQNYPPYFLSSPIELGPFPANSAISLSLGPFVGDLEDTLTFALVSGPPWLSLNSLGMLSGTPTTQNIGPHSLTVSIDDGQNPIVQSVVKLTVATPQNSGHPNLTINLGETLVLSTGTANYTDVINHGTLRIQDPAILDIVGTFSNTGIIDIIHWSGTLPLNLANTGTVIDRSNIKIISTETTATDFVLGVPNYQGHLYQLQGTENLAAPWESIGDPVPGSPGSASNPPALLFTAPRPGPTKFFRVAVTPAP